jgi:hypothetical protein
VVCILSLSAVGLLAQSARNTPTPDANKESAKPAFRNTAPGVPYVGSKVCGTCHSDVYQRYMETGMGRSASLAIDPAQLALVSSPVTVQQGSRYFEVSRKGNALYQSVYELGPDGQPVYRHSEQMLYAIGSGTAGYTYLVQRGNRLYEAPLSYFSALGSWAVSPGYEFKNQVFDRPAIFQCIVCHTGRARPLAQTDGAYRDPPVVEEQIAVGCENCHGPGQVHVQQRLHGASLTSTIDASIVNPAKLPSWLANNICMECHEGGDSRVLRPSKTLFDVRPGTPLDRVVSIFRAAPTPASVAESPHLAYYWSLTMSRCFLGSGGRMTCFTCHDPHTQPSTEQAVEFFRNKCLTCHNNLSCKLRLAEREARTPPNNCFGCHMLQTKAPPGTHADQTEHRIVASEGEAPPDSVFHWATAELPDLVQVNAVPDDIRSIPPLTQLQAYQDLATSDPQRYQRTLLSVLQRTAGEFPDNPLVLRALVNQSHAQENEAGRAEAIQELARVIELGAGTPDDYFKLGGLLAVSDLVTQAIPMVEKAVQLNPYDKEFYPLLVLCYFSLHQDATARLTIRQWLKLFPEDQAKAAAVEKDAATDYPAQ